jgi:hypothetical protein
MCLREISRQGNDSRTTVRVAYAPTQCTFGFALRIRASANSKGHADHLRADLAPGKGPLGRRMRARRTVGGHNYPLQNWCYNYLGREGPYLVTFLLRISRRITRRLVRCATLPTDVFLPALFRRPLAKATAHDGGFCVIELQWTVPCFAVERSREQSLTGTRLYAPRPLHPCTITYCSARPTRPTRFYN